MIEYVPSSNEDSPPPSFLSDSYLNLEEEIVKDVCDYFSRHEIDINKYDLPYTSNAGIYCKFQNLQKVKTTSQSVVLGSFGGIVSL